MEIEGRRDFRSISLDVRDRSGFCGVVRMDRSYEGFVDAMCWNAMLDYFQSLGMDLSPCDCRDEWPEDRLDVQMTVDA